MSGAAADASLLGAGTSEGGGDGLGQSAEDLLGGGVGEGEQDWPYDPNEPRYCVCNQVSYGDMVACDNEDVSDGTVVTVS